MNEALLSVLDKLINVTEEAQVQEWELYVLWSSHVPHHYFNISMAKSEVM
jgi:hypothetical protein